MPEIFSDQRIWMGDCCSRMSKHIRSQTIDCVITSPPYNLGIDYSEYEDNLSQKLYVKFLRKVFKQIHRVMKDDASFFLNMGFSNIHPWVSHDIFQVARKYFVLQNKICWIKSISVDDKTYGHFKPINSKRFLNNNFEDVFHFTKKGATSIDRLAIGVPYADKSNITRWKGGGRDDLRCAGNCWFIPYQTIQSKNEKGNHPAIFPVEFALKCMKLHGINNFSVILDPFCGTGSTLVAAKQLNISAIGIDIDSNYIKEAKARLANCDS